VFLNVPVQFGPVYIVAVQRVREPRVQTGKRRSRRLTPVSVTHARTLQPVVE